MRHSVEQVIATGQNPGIGVKIPYESLDVIFLDVGNTLLSIDFERVVDELGARGIQCGVHELCRAEAAARPSISERIAGRAKPEGETTFRFYVGSVLQELPPARALSAEQRAALVVELAAVLRVPGQSNRLWCRVIPGVPEALERLRAAGLRLSVVSNSDGSVETALAEQQLRHFFEAVHDSHWVGYEKPDPRIFQHALARAGVDAARTLHVGDLYAADVAGARAAGIHPLLLDPFSDWAHVDCERQPDLAAVVEAVLAARA